MIVVLIDELLLICASRHAEVLAAHALGRSGCSSAYISPAELLELPHSLSTVPTIHPNKPGADVSAAARALHEGPHHYNSQLPITTLRAVSAGCPFSSSPSL
jgi:hypothetical protein